MKMWIFQRSRKVLSIGNMLVMILSSDHLRTRQLSTRCPPMPRIRPETEVMLWNIGWFLMNWIIIFLQLHQIQRKLTVPSSIHSALLNRLLRSSTVLIKKHVFMSTVHSSLTRISIQSTKTVKSRESIVVLCLEKILSLKFLMQKFPSKAAILKNRIKKLMRSSRFLRQRTQCSDWRIVRFPHLPMRVAFWSKP